MAALIGKRGEDGRRLLQPLHLCALGYLSALFPDLEGVVSRAQLLEWFEDCHADTPRRLLCDLRDLGLIEYRPDRAAGAIWVASRVADQPCLPLAEEPQPVPDSMSESGIRSGGVSTDSLIESGIRSPNPGPPPHPLPDPPQRSCSLLGESKTPPEKHERRSAPAGAGREPPSGAKGGEGGRPDRVVRCNSEPEWSEIRRRCRQVMGRNGLTPGESQQYRRFVAAGGAMADVDDAVEWWEWAASEGQAPRKLDSFGFILRRAGWIAEARQRGIAESQPAPAAGSEPSPIPARRAFSPARRLTMDEEVQRLLGDLEYKRANGNGNRSR